MQVSVNPRTLDAFVLLSGFVSAPVKNGAIMAGSGRSQWSTRESPRSTETQ
jgi:hypothetical protein